YPFVEPI
nr:Chain A, BETA-CASOMORPHIN-7 [Homo sapiens]2BB4_P Chain P, beta-casomorphin-7 [synthetic construct]2BD2_P Chain P, beta-casomorphin-7 [synthetic construct]2BD3_P Chain P, beta-casomorphin-7 [synthetic construct]2BD4_P Chain P, beta-casomorphin-7 [synthetic construct]2BD5_P Chain P, beta-casomorphin-7 [synthetic construct]2BD7_P Chain P, beta-casomorphin-7 [synthetic construct]2BD8_P Chain P, beta-casomorphin-7 [synthetic construct]